MPSGALHVLLELGERGDVVDGPSIRTGRRNLWDITLNVPVVGASLDVDLQTAPADDESSWTTHYSFPQITTTGQVTYAATLADEDLWLRLVVTAHVGDYWLEGLGLSPWLRTAGTGAAADLQLVGQQLREWEDGLVRTVEEAERAVLAYLWEGDTLDAYIDHPRFLDAMKRAVASQADHLFQRHRLGESKDPSAQVTLREMPYMGDGVMEHLAEFRPAASTVWRGR
jgi:hypothetical protein